MADRFSLQRRRRVAGARRQSGRLMELPILIAVVFIAAAIFVPRVMAGEGVFLSLLVAAGWVAAIVGGLLALAFLAELPGMVWDRFTTPVAVRAVRKRNALEALRRIAPERLDVRAADRLGNTALHVACDSKEEKRKREAPEIIKFLLQHGAQVNAENKIELTPLHLAVQNQYGVDAVRCLLAAGAEPRYALYNVVAWSGPEAVETARALLDAGADASGRGVPGMSMSPLHWAARSGDADMVRLLIARGADPNARDTSDLTVLHHSMSILGFNDERTAQIVAVLVAAGADRDAADRSGQTPRMRASESGHPALIAAMNGAPGA